MVLSVWLVRLHRSKRNRLEFDLKALFNLVAFLAGDKSNTSQKPKPAGESQTGKKVLKEGDPINHVGLSCPIGFPWKPWMRTCRKTKLVSVLFVMSKSKNDSMDRSLSS